jgi:4-hydroxyphenylpyruvate dioxygenase
VPSLKIPANLNPRCPAVRGFDYVELFVANVRLSAHYYTTIWGFQPVACQTARIGPRDRFSMVMRQGSITLLLTNAIGASSPVAEH